MTLTTLLKPGEAGTGNQSQTTSDIAGSTDNAIVSVPGVGAGTLPQIFLDISFDAPAGAIYAETIVTSLPTVYYRLDESSGPVIDATGRLNLSVFGGVTRAQASLLPGDPNPCYDLNGTTGYVAATDNGLLGPPIASNPEDQSTDPHVLTLEALIRPDSITGIRSIISRGIAGSDLLIWNFRLNNGRLEIVCRDPLDAVRTYAATQLLAVSTAYHVACTVTQVAVSIYIDGTLAAYFPKSWTQFKLSASSYFAIGSSTYTAPSNFFDGRIDEVAVYELALPSEEMTYHQTARSAPTTFTWTTVSDDTAASSRQQSLSIRRGRSDIFRDPETGLMTTQLRNQDRRFDPGNSSGPYYPNLDPVRPCRLRVVKDAISYNLYRGDIEDWPQDWQGRENTVTLTALDAFEPLSKVRVKIDAPAELTGARVIRILDAAGWPRGLRQIDPGKTMCKAWFEQEGSALELLFLIVATESGNTYVNGDGFVVFKERLSRVIAPLSVVKATFSNLPTGGELPLVDAEVVEDKDQILNHVTIRVTDGIEYTAMDGPSALRNRKRSYEKELPLQDEDEAVVKAHWILQMFKDPFIRVNKVVIEPQMNANMWAHALGREIGDRIRFKIYPPGTGVLLHDLQAIIEHVEHRYIVGRWTTTWTLSPADVNQYWILGTSSLGVDNKIAY